MGLTLLFACRNKIYVEFIQTEKPFSLFLTSKTQADAHI